MIGIRLTTLAAAAVLALAMPAQAQQMCGGTSGSCGMSGPQAQSHGTMSMPMQGQAQGQMPMQGMAMMGGCPMMKQMAMLQERVRMMEDMMDIKPPQAR